MQRRKESLKKFQQSWEETQKECSAAGRSRFSNFVSLLCQQQDMFVVCDLLNKLFQPLPSDLEAVESMVQKKNDKGKDNPSGNDSNQEEAFADKISISDRNKLINKLMQNKFLIDSKYKAHKECWVSVMS